MGTMRINCRRSHPPRRRSTYTLPLLAALFLILSAFFLLFGASHATIAVPSSHQPSVCPRTLGPEYRLSTPYHHSSFPDTNPSIPRGINNVHSGQLDEKVTKKSTENDDKEDTSAHHDPKTPTTAATTTTWKVPRAEAEANSNPNAISQPTHTQTQTQTSAPFPASMYDTPGHAIASGLFVGTAGTALCWVIGFILKVYATWIWRAVTGVARGLEPVRLDRVLMQDHAR